MQELSVLGLIDSEEANFNPLVEIRFPYAVKGTSLSTLMDIFKSWNTAFKLFRIFDISFIPHLENVGHHQVIGL